MMTDTAITPGGAPKGSPVTDPTRGKAPRASHHPLLGAFPLGVMTLATFLVVFAIMMARLQGGLDPALRAAGATKVVRNAGRTTVVTRTSGGVSPASSPTGAPVQVGAPVLTRTSGGASSGGGEESDDA